MKPEPNRRSIRAFTLIELLIVIAIIAILAALVMPITGAVNAAKIRSKAKAELTEIESAILNYKSKHGFFPPDNPGNPNALNQLYYELLGTKATINGTTPTFTTLDGASTIDSAGLTTAFGGNVSAVMNTSRGAGSDEGVVASKFLINLKPNQVGELINGAKFLVCSVAWPNGQPGAPIATGVAKVDNLNPWHYNSSSPTNNPKTFDLWVDVMVRGKTNRISNWSEKPIVL